MTNKLRIEVPEGKTLMDATVTLNGIKLENVMSVHLEADTDMALPQVCLKLRVNSIETDNLDVVLEELD